MMMCFRFLVLRQYYFCQGSKVYSKLRNLYIHFFIYKEIEKGLDWQTTRTFMGNTFPGPGLFSKFYDTDHEPLVEEMKIEGKLHEGKHY